MFQGLNRFFFFPPLGKVVCQVLTRCMLIKLGFINSSDAGFRAIRVTQSC